MGEKLSATEKIGNFIASVLLGNTREVIARVDERTKLMLDDLREVKNSVSVHSSDIRALQVHTNFGISHSPTVPSKKGEKLLEDSGFNKIYPEVKEKIFTILDKKKVRTLYDYEKEAEKSLWSIKDDRLFDDIKDYALNHPETPLDFIFIIASWILRDDYVKHKKTDK